MIINKAKVELVEFKKTKEKVIYKYNVEHNNGKTSVDQDMIISSNGHGSTIGSLGWTASISLDEFPVKSSPEEAAEKLADWMMRLSKAIRSGDYLDYQRSKFKDLVDEATNDNS